MPSDIPYQDCGDRICIIGGGPGGLCMARALKRQGLDVLAPHGIPRFRNLGDFLPPGMDSAKNAADAAMSGRAAIAVSAV